MIRNRTPASLTRQKHVPRNAHILMLGWSMRRNRYRAPYQIPYQIKLPLIASHESWTWHRRDWFVAHTRTPGQTNKRHGSQSSSIAALISSGHFVLWPCRKSDNYEGDEFTGTEVRAKHTGNCTQPRLARLPSSQTPRSRGNCIPVIADLIETQTQSAPEGTLECFVTTPAKLRVASANPSKSKTIVNARRKKTADAKCIRRRYKSDVSALPRWAKKGPGLLSYGRISFAARASNLYRRVAETSPFMQSEGHFIQSSFHARNMCRPRRKIHELRWWNRAVIFHFFSLEDRDDRASFVARPGVCVSVFHFNDR